MAAAVLILFAGMIGLFIQNSRMRSEMASIQQQNEEDRRRMEAQIVEKQEEQQEIENQLAAEREKGIGNETRIKELESQRSKLEKEIEDRRRIDATPNGQQPVRQPTLASLVISPGLFTRSDGQPMNRIELSASARQLNLGLRLKNVDDYPGYLVKISDIDSGREVLTRTNLKPRGKGTKKSLNLSIPAQLLGRGDYEVELSGITQTGETEEITKYYFSVVK